EHAALDCKVGDAGRVVLAPVPEREGRGAVELPAERPVPEHPRGMYGVRLQQEDRERGQRRDGEAGQEVELTAPAGRVRQPERYQRRGEELRPAAERAEGAARPGGPREPEAPDEEGWGDGVVRVRVHDVLREGVGGPRERKRRRQAVAAVPPPDEDESQQAQPVETDGRRLRRG